MKAKNNKRVHNLKIDERWADDILFHNKTFEVRRNDRNYQKGDLIVFNVVEEGGYIWRSETNIEHELTGKEYEIIYVHSGLGLEEGYVVLGIKPV